MSYMPSRIIYRIFGYEHKMLCDIISFFNNMLNIKISLDKLYYTTYNIENKIKKESDRMAFPISSGLLDALVLAVVDKDDTYGYRITQDIRQAMEMSESTLYPVLRRLLKDDCLETYDREYMGRNRRYYKVTPKGEAQLMLYRQEWTEYKYKIDNVMGEAVKE